MVILMVITINIMFFIATNQVPSWGLLPVKTYKTYIHDIFT